MIQGGSFTVKLIELSSDTKSFHTITFKDELNLIVGKKFNPADKNTRNTYNGVGKSLIVYLIHFCLGSNAISAFKEKIPNWNFYLKFSIGEEEFLVRRNTSSQSAIYLNSEKLTLTQFRELMLIKNFSIIGKTKNLTFNTLFPRFIRRDRACYNNFDDYIVKEQDYQKLLNNSFLLGLNIDIIEEKKKLREFQTNTDSLKKSLEKDPVLKEHFNHKNDTEIEINDLKESISALEEEIKSFKIASNYDQIEQQADQLAYELKGLTNERTLISNDISNIEKSIKLEPKVSTEKIVKLYNAINIEIPEMIKKKLDESIDFHDALLSKRRERLLKELRKTRSLLKEMENSIEIKGKDLDKQLGYLETHGALDEYTSLNRKLVEQKTKLEKLTEYKEIMKSYKKKLLEIKSEYTNSAIETQEYLELNAELIEKIQSSFRDLTKEFYDKGVGIKIESNEGENTQRFSIDVRIQDDSSDGVNEVKIFCYDLMVLLLQINHEMKFVFHDSRLFSNMDPRQRGTVFKLISSRISGSGLQYIATVNQDQLESFRDDYEEDEYKRIIEDNIVLTLTDESSESKLLGIQVDMKYEKA